MGKLPSSILPLLDHLRLLHPFYLFVHFLYDFRLALCVLLPEEPTEPLDDT